MTDGNLEISIDDFSNLSNRSRSKNASLSNRAFGMLCVRFARCNCFVSCAMVLFSKQNEIIAHETNNCILRNVCCTHETKNCRPPDCNLRFYIARLPTRTCFPDNGTSGKRQGGSSDNRWSPGIPKASCKSAVVQCESQMLRHSEIHPSNSLFHQSNNLIVAPDTW